MIELWKVLAGATIFALGMNFLEEAMQKLSGRKFKLFLKKHTYRTISAIGIGTFVSGILQSSSVVNLLILSLTGSGGIPLRNALAVTLGSNLGTTLNTWILSSVGFRFDIATIAFPAIAFAGLMRALLKDKPIAYNWFSFLLGFGFILLGLEFIKTGVKDYVGKIDLALFSSYPVIVYLLVGILITALLQSSTATVAIVLSSLHSQAIGLYAATAVVLGSEIGSTIKFFFVSYGRDPSVKRVALGNFLFNLLNAIVILLLLIPVNKLITEALSIKDPLTALAFFQTFINIIAIILFVPLLSLSEKFLMRRFVDDRLATKYIGKVPVPDTELAIAALENETLHFLETVLQFAANVLDYGKELPLKDLSPFFLSQNLAEQYYFIKQLNGDIYKYYIAVQQAQTSAAQVEKLDRLMSSVREGIFAAKSLHDVERDVIQLRKSANETKYESYLQSRESASTLLMQFSRIIQAGSKGNKMRPLTNIYQVIWINYCQTFNYHAEKIAGLSEIELSTIINLNRELYNAFHSIVLSIKDLLLEGKELANFEDFMEKESEKVL